jgi:hypothetical protein
MLPRDVQALREGIDRGEGQDSLLRVIASASEAWTDADPATRETFRLQILSLLDQFCMKIQGYRPAQATLGPTFGFPGLTG